MEFNEDTQKILGIGLSILSVLLVVFWFFIAFKYPFISVDEWYTKGLVYFKIKDLLAAVSIDVHPPLYYIILKAGMKPLNAANIHFDLLFYLKFMSLVPYLIILATSFTKIKKEYGYLTSGVFSFTLISMSTFFIQYLTARMYSWNLLFLLLSFIYLKDVLDSDDKKSWILFSVFTVLGAYTHYYSIFSSLILYLLLFGYLFKNKKSSLKKFFASVFGCIIAYLPWFIVLLGQLSEPNNPGMGEVSFMFLLKVIRSGMLTSNDNLLVVIFAILMCLAMALVFKDYLTERNSDNFYLSSGMAMWIGTIILGFAISIIFRPVLSERYFIPCIGIFWFVLSIYISKLNNKKLILILICAILLVGCVNVDLEFEKINKQYKETLKSYDIIEKINNNDSIIIYEGINKYIRLNKYLNKIDDHRNMSLDEIRNGSDEFNSLLKQNKTVYFIGATKSKINETDYNTTKVGVIKPCGIYKVTSKI